MKCVKELLLLILLVTLLYSCKDETKDETVKEEKTVKDAVTASVTYSINGGEDMLKLVDIMVEYTGKEGEKETEEVESLPWTKKIDGLALSFTAASRLQVAAKKDLDISLDKYNVGISSNISWSKSDGSFESSEMSNNMTIAASKVEAYLEKLVQKNFEKSTVVSE